MFHNNRQPSFQTNRSSQNLNFDRKQMPSYGYHSVPKGPYPFYGYSRWKQYMPRYQQKPAFYFQDKSTFYYMSDPIYTADNRIIVKGIFTV